jgi:hypothetical protein
LFAFGFSLIVAILIVTKLYLVLICIFLWLVKLDLFSYAYCSFCVIFAEMPIRGLCAFLISLFWLMFSYRDSYIFLIFICCWGGMETTDCPKLSN